MRRLVLLCTTLCGMVLSISTSPAWAGSVLWVANNGNDLNNCSQVSPCATFFGAVAKGGVSQINCLTSGDYGGVYVTTSIVIDCGAGNVGTISTPLGGPAVLIETSSAATIILRHLSMNGLGIGVDGIDAKGFHSGTLIVQDCTINGFTNEYGINFAPTGGRGTLEVSNSSISGNGFGIYVAPAATRIASVTLDQVRLTGNSGHGLAMFGAGVVAGTIRNSLVATNAVNGVYVGAPQAYFTVEHSSIIANLSVGVRTSSAGANVNIADSAISGNGTGVFSFAGSIISFGNNTLNSNGTNGSFTSTTTLR